MAIVATVTAIVATVVVSAALPLAVALAFAVAVFGGLDGLGSLGDSLGLRSARR
jgi:hypothetical protein